MLQRPRRRKPAGQGRRRRRRPGRRAGPARREQRRSRGRPPPTAAPAPRDPGQAAAGGPGPLGSAELSLRRPDTPRGTAARHARNPAHRLRPVSPTRARASGPHGPRRGSVHASQGARGPRDPRPSRRTRLPGKAAGQREPRQAGRLTPVVAAGAGPPRPLSGEGRIRGLANGPVALEGGLWARGHAGAGRALRPSDAGPVAFEASRVSLCPPHAPPAPYLHIVSEALAVLGLVFLVLGQLPGGFPSEQTQVTPILGLPRPPDPGIWSSAPQPCHPHHMAPFTGYTFSVWQ
ncbi:uncharacterized protein LOC110318058 [Mus pahari]|uniref:uncharacterized protein LOC110318058 n=1 Tax=Mus pahari TaxID=10093 RepID=UPI000A30F1F3|nr:uncharacterized protein LOC110318058 [Mus pahari]